MRVINNPDLIETNNNSVAIGDFDGLHRGHMALMDCLTYNKTVLTFDKRANCIYTQLYKERLLESIGINTLIVQDFTSEFMHTDATYFFNNYLIKRLKASKLVVGYNFRFGYKNHGDTSLLQELCRRENVELCVIPPVEVEGEVVSSTIIRQYISCGNISRAAELLARPVSIYGSIEQGRQLGRELGFPTANIPLNEMQILPPDGVYLTEAEIDGVNYFGIGNLGCRPTVNGSTRRMEVHFIGFKGDLYNRTICVHILEHIRDIVKFSSLEHLKEQLTIDLTRARELIYRKY